MSDQNPWQFDLPEELIAQDPPPQRGDSRLMLVEPGVGPSSECVFRDLPSLLRPGDLLVLNDSRVLPARLLTRRLDTGGQVELLLIRPVEHQTWLAMAKPARRLRPGIRLAIGRGPDLLEIREKRADGQVLVSADPDPGQLAAEHGVMPLPPYIHRDANDPRGQERCARDRTRYQTVYNLPDESGAGSMAAPTAGLHFSDQTMTALVDRGIRVARVSLHVGPGTFKPPTQAQIAAGRLHREFFRYGADTHQALRETRAQGGRVIAVGTTSLRVLETVARLALPDDCPDAGPDSGPDQGVHELVFAPTRDGGEPVFTGQASRDSQGNWQVSGMTRLFIQPPEKVTAVDGLLTNFHLPGSSLLMLVASLAGSGVWQAAYARAIERRMRFYSYGDCMLLLPGCRL